jgi:hypothetical protein
VTTGSDEARARAEKAFKKEEQAKEAAKAMMEYQANSRFMREKTARLRALRLAKEAAEKELVGGSPPIDMTAFRRHLGKKVT